MLEEKAISNVKLELLPENLNLMLFCHSSSATVLQTFETAPEMKAMYVHFCIKAPFFFPLRRWVHIKKHPPNSSKKNINTKTTNTTSQPKNQTSPLSFENRRSPQTLDQSETLVPDQSVSVPLWGLFMGWCQVGGQSCTKL